MKNGPFFPDMIESKKVKDKHGQVGKPGRPTFTRHAFHLPR